MDHTTLSRRGGKMVLKKYGKDYFAKLAKKSGDAKLKKYGTEYYRNLSRLGVEARKKKAEEKKPLVEKIVDAVTSI